MSFDKIFNKLASQEEAFFKSQFLSPVVYPYPIRVRISNIIHTLTIIKPKEYSGWAVFEPYRINKARFVREANMRERQDYLNLFPILRLIICSRTENDWFGIPANASDSRFKITGLIPIRLPQEVQMFNKVQTRFDGSNCWFDCIDFAASLKNAAFLREQIVNLIEPNKVEIPGLTKEEKLAYGISFASELENRKDQQEERIKDALLRAGAEYRSYLERPGSYVIQYTVDGETHTSVVDKETLEVQSAGICLSGGDRLFDLTSLVGVVREGSQRGRINRVGLGRDYDDYDDDD